MIGFGLATRVYLAAGATDMRKGFDGLFGIARDRLGMDPLSGHLFVFCNGRRNEQGRVRMSSEELTLLVSGIELSQSRRKDWYRKEIVEAGAEKPGD